MFANANTSVRVLRRSVVNEEGAEASTVYNAHTFYVHIYYIHIGVYIYILFERNGRRRWYFWKYTAAAEYIIYGKNTCGGGGRIHR